MHLYFATLYHHKAPFNETHLSSGQPPLTTPFPVDTQCCALLVLLWRGSCKLQIYIEGQKQLKERMVLKKSLPATAVICATLHGLAMKSYRWRHGQKATV